jgi:hypothetical protein
MWRDGTFDVAAFVRIQMAARRTIHLPARVFLCVQIRYKIGSEPDKRMEFEVRPVTDRGGVTETHRRQLMQIVWRRVDCRRRQSWKV